MKYTLLLSVAICLLSCQPKGVYYCQCSADVYDSFYKKNISKSLMGAEYRDSKKDDATKSCNDLGTKYKSEYSNSTGYVGCYLTTGNQGL